MILSFFRILTKEHCEAEHGDSMKFSLIKKSVPSRNHKSRLKVEKGMKREILDQTQSGRKMIVILKKLDLD